MNSRKQEAVIQIKQVAATMAVEDMYFDKRFLEEMLLVAKGEKSSEEVRRGVINKYAKEKNQ